MPSYPNGLSNGRPIFKADKWSFVLDELPLLLPLTSRTQMGSALPPNSTVSLLRSQVWLTSQGQLCLFLIFLPSLTLVWVCSDQCLPNQQNNRSIAACRSLLRPFWPTFSFRCRFRNSHPPVIQPCIRGKEMQKAKNKKQKNKNLSRKLPDKPQLIAEGPEKMKV